MTLESTEFGKDDEEALQEFNARHLNVRVKSVTRK
jgi:hypothetical protein